jgi:hypothetical protein
MLQEALDEVWFPFWEAHPEALEDEEQDLMRPGRRFAKRNIQTRRPGNEPQRRDA